MKALSNLKVLDFTTLLPGPYATMMLADLGAEVLKVSSPSKPDLILDHAPFVEGTEIPANEAWLGRGKKNIFLNLKSPEAIAIIKELVKEYDIVIEQFRPGVMERLGLGYEDLKKENPRLIYCSLTGYGQTGPRAKTAAHDNNFVALSGNLSMMGYKSTGPAPMNFQLGDICSGSSNSVISILAAVNQRTMTGEGQYIDVSMLDGLIPLMTMDATKFLATGEETGREDSRFNGGSVYGYYETKDGEYYSVGSLEPKFWEIFCNTIGCPELIPGTSEPENLEETKEKVAAAMKTKTKAEWRVIFDPLDCCVEPVLTMKEALNEDEHIQARGMVVEVEVPCTDGKKVRQLGSQFKLSASPVTYDMGGYPLGYHTKEIIESMGLDYEVLKEKGAFK
ncbi:MAG: CoA transferase [Firmicutes bacterium]|nr:CoA transferase [Bacillota bacterium]